MTTTRLWHSSLIAVVALISANLQAQDFSQTCEAQGATAAKSQFLAQLEQAERAAATGDLAAADRMRFESENLLIGVAGHTGAAAVKCLGESVYERYFKLLVQIYQLRARDNPTSGEIQAVAAFWAAVTDPSKGPDSVVAALPVDSRQYNIAMSVVAGQGELAWMYREIGAFVTHEESDAERLAPIVAGVIKARADEYSQAALGEEAVVFNREPTAEEQQAAAQLEQVGALADAMSGVDMNSAEQAEFGRVKRRVLDSRKKLEEARAWDFNTYSFGMDEPPATDTLAKERGGEIFAMGRNESLSYKIRDEYYELALSYYNMCTCYEQLATVSAAQDAIQPMLEEEEAREQAQTEQMQAEMQPKLEAMQQGIDDIQKTETEKETFKSEADALEAELGF